MEANVQQVVRVIREGIYESGIRFPEALKTEISLGYSIKKPEGTLIGWDFRCVLPHQFDYRLFPLDQQHLPLILQPRDLTANVIIVRDLDAPDPALPAKTTVSGYQVVAIESGYLPDQTATEAHNEEQTMGFGLLIHLQRNLLNSFVVYLLPLFIIFIILFAVHYLMDIRRERYAEPSALLSNGLAAMSAYIALFFSLILMHQSLRNSLNASTIVYLEYFFFLAYLTTLLFTLVTLRIINRRGETDEKDRILMLFSDYYWPIQTSIWFVFTLLNLYRL